MKKCLPQEGLKLIACITMFIDHVGAVFFPYQYWLRIIGRLAFPIYCFLLVQGSRYTHDSKRYGLRLAIGAVLSEFSFDYLFFGGVTLAHQSVMVTLLIGFVMLQWLKYVKKLGPVGSVLPLAVCFLAAEALNTDYGGWGIAMIWLLAVTGENWSGWLLRLAGLAAVGLLMNSFKLSLGPIRVPVQLFAVFSLIPIFLYSGKKLTRSKFAQTAFYLFYPAHLTFLLAVLVILR